MTIQKMTRSAARTIADDAQAALEDVAKRHGLTLKKGGGQYDPIEGTFTPKFTFICATEDGIPSDFSSNAPLYGLTDADYGRIFSTHHGQFTICGIAPRSRKYPILAKCSNSGKTYKFAASDVSGGAA